MNIFKNDLVVIIIYIIHTIKIRKSGKSNKNFKKGGNFQKKKRNFMILLI